MDQKLREKVEEILNDGNAGYAYLYLSNQPQRQEFVFKLTPENIANFLGSHFLEAKQMIITDMGDRFILDTFGGFINTCPNQKLCLDILHHLRPIQMGEKEAEEVLMVTRDEFDEYGRWEDEMVTMAEMAMG